MVCKIPESLTNRIHNLPSTETRDPYNRSGSLTAWTDGPEILDAHKSTKNRGVEFFLSS